MPFRLFRRSSNAAVIDRLYARVVEASRQPALYADLGIPDTYEGRFESLALHMILVLRRLQSCAAPGPDMAQHLIDTTFKHFDRTLREMGVGDTVVPKRMKVLAESFLGRRAAYEEALTAEAPAAGSGAPPGARSDALAATLARNVYTGRRDAAGLAAYATEAVAGLAETPLQGFIDGDAPFPDPAAFATETTP